MFDSIIPKIVKCDNLNNNIYLQDPKNLVIQSTKGSESIIASIEKGASNYLYKNYHMKENTSKEVYKISPDIWRELINECEAQGRTEQGFYLTDNNNLFFITSSNELIDICKTRDEDDIDQINAKYETFKLDLTEMTKTKKFYTEGKNGLIKMLFYKADRQIESEDYTPVVLLEANPFKSQYTIFTGILLYKLFMFIPSLSPYNIYESYVDLIRCFSIDNAIDYAEDKAKELYDDYLIFKSNGIEISARELMSLIHKVGYKLKLKTDNDLDEIDGIEEVESSERIQNFFNTFKFTTGESAVDIVNLSEFKKIFKYNKLTLLDILEILSREYVKHEGSKVTADILSNLMFSLYNKKNDKDQVDDIKQVFGE